MDYAVSYYFCQNSVRKLSRETQTELLGTAFSFLCDQALRCACDTMLDEIVKDTSIILPQE